MFSCMFPPRVPILSPDIQQLLADEFRPGEKQVWAAQPLPRLFRRQAIGFVIFGIPWTAFAIFWTVSAGHGIWGHMDRAGVMEIFFPMTGLLPIAIGLGMLSSPFWMGRRALRTVYVITDQRAMVFTGKVFGGVKIQSFEPERLTSIERNQRADGGGDLIFETFTQKVGTGTSTVRRGFMGIENVRQVEALIHSTLLNGRVRKAD